MQTQKTSLSIMSALGIILFISLFVIILFKDTIFEYILEYTGESSIKESEQATTETTNLILSLEKITFDTKVLSLPYVQGLTTFPSFPADSETLTNFGKSILLWVIIILLLSKLLLVLVVWFIVYKEKETIIMPLEL